MATRVPSLAGAALALLLCLPAVAAAAPVRVVVSIPPLAWFAGHVGGAGVEVASLLKAGDSPHTWEPTPQAVARLAEADLFLCAGVGFERGLRRRVAAMAGGIRVAGPLPPAGHDHDHGDGHGDDLADDPHTWLSPAGASAIADTLARVLGPSHADVAAGRARTEARIAEVDSAAAALLAGCRGRAFLVFHPAFGHFAARYGLVQLAIEDEGREPGPRRMAEITDQARQRGVRAVVVQPQMSRRAADAVAASLGVPVIVLDPLAPDWDANYLRIAAALAAALGDAPAGKDPR
ncbi:MAG TPA: zinc ABC transporter substrate-binding protein [Candidatus Krumholzibacteria bacterium]|nr:zinc ABC transporter substrate-binding protein [Candidatus Krumholzibacteria bacterium]